MLAVWDKQQGKTTVKSIKFVLKESYIAEVGYNVPWGYRAGGQTTHDVGKYKYICISESEITFERRKKGPWKWHHTKEEIWCICFLMTP